MSLRAFVAAACVVIAVGPPAHALTDREILEALEAIEDYETAYPLALMLASEGNSYKDWRHIVLTYGQWDDGTAYDMAWKAARDVDSELAYLDFMELKPQSPTNAFAVRAIYEQKSELDTIAGYRKFIDRFPNSAEAVNALLRIHEIAFERAQEVNEPDVFDAFVVAFPAAEQTSDAIALAAQREPELVEEELRALERAAAADEKRERIARRLYNEARMAETNDDYWIAVRKYDILETNKAFRDTGVLTEMMDRAERLQYQQVMIGHQQEISSRINSLQQAVTEELRLTAERLELALDEYDRRIQDAMRAQSESLHQYVDTKIGAIGSAMRQQQEAMAQALRDASYRSQALFRQAQEEARWKSYEDRRCAEQLAKYGHYTWLSNC